MFGIPHVGADICGFIGETTPELCLRWYQVGSFYPFSRNHNSIGFKDQDPGSFGPKVAFNIRHALRLRYNLLPYLYTLFYNHRIYGSTVVRAMWNVFPRDLTCRGLDEQFMWGDGLLIAPVVAKGHTHKSVFFPGDGNRWYDFSYYLHTGTIAEVPKVFIGKRVKSLLLWKSCPSLFEEDSFFPYRQMPWTQPSPDTMTSPPRGRGKLFYDDGYSEGTLEAQEYYLARFIYDPQSSTLESQVLMRGYPPMKNLKLSFVGISGLEAKSIHYIVVNNSTVIGDYDYLNGRLAIRNLSLRMNEAFSITLHEGQ
ncbi:Sucraseisomaltase_ intestinallike [Caligus rogercresseyi]|uniref:Sucraseisomaltase_ intestinallike n=1 Tax=Caligus rogercresseyi TaxID=217165 RepID=A0A7T8JY06_CALRO|nr:Sucraseisomaltase_ intestinallike [Caligus rogercresseyi]